MIFDNVFFSATFYVMLFSFVTGFVGFLLIGTILKKRSPQLVQYKSGSKFYLSALICGLTSSFFLSIVICTLTPTLITVEDDLSYTEELSFTSNGQFIGIGGSYIANNSNKSLHLVGIGEDEDIDVIISPLTIEKIRKCPEVYFKEVPDHQYKRVTKTRRGRRKTISGPSVYLVEY